VAADYLVTYRPVALAGDALEGLAPAAQVVVTDLMRRVAMELE
jgi:hypothetical protein